MTYVLSLAEVWLPGSSAAALRSIAADPGILQRLLESVTAQRIDASFPMLVSLTNESMQIVQCVPVRSSTPCVRSYRRLLRATVAY